MSRFKSKTPISPGTTTKGGLRNKQARIRQLLKDRRGNEVHRRRGYVPIDEPQKPKTYKEPINPAVIGGSPNQKFKDEKQKKKKLRIKNRNINRPGTDPVKTPTGVNRPGTDIKKKNKIKSLSGKFFKTLFNYGITLGPTVFATNELYKKYLELKKKNKT